MATILRNIQQVRARIERACVAAGRPVQSVTLLCVGKRQPAAVLREAFTAGERCFGENYVQEAVDKMEGLADLRGRIEWHLIGPVQSNKTRLVAERFDWVHAVDRAKVAQRLSEQRPETSAPLQLCLQVNVSGEGSKSGVAPAQVLTLARTVAALPRVRLRGLMAIPEPQNDPLAQRQPHARLRELLELLRRDGLEVDTLSMGMSDDLEAAVAEGATIVRVGTALFGARTPGIVTA